MALVDEFIETKVQYPADQDDVLERCALTSECGGKMLVWLTNHLPEGEYQSADEVRAAFKQTEAAPPAEPAASR